MTRRNRRNQQRAAKELGTRGSAVSLVRFCVVADRVEPTPNTKPVDERNRRFDVWHAEPGSWRYFECIRGTTRKFWSITLHEDGYTTTWGRIGTQGQSKKKTINGPHRVAQAYNRIVNEKVTDKGYVEVRRKRPGLPMVELLPYAP